MTMTDKERDLLTACAQAIAFSRHSYTYAGPFKDEHRDKVKQLLEEVREEDGTGKAPKAQAPEFGHPIQPMVWDNNVIRFKKNAIVEFLLKRGGFDMNDLAVMEFSDEDRAQFAMLIGYSVSGFGDLSYAEAIPGLVDRCDDLAEARAHVSPQADPG